MEPKVAIRSKQPIATSQAKATPAATRRERSRVANSYGLELSAARISPTSTYRGAAMRASAKAMNTSPDARVPRVPRMSTEPDDTADDAELEAAEPVDPKAVQITRHASDTMGMGDKDATPATVPVPSGVAALAQDPKATRMQRTPPTSAAALGIENLPGTPISLEGPRNGRLPESTSLAFRPQSRNLD